MDRTTAVEANIDAIARMVPQDRRGGHTEALAILRHLVDEQGDRLDKAQTAGSKPNNEKSK
ncbi:MAG: hypothetical protein AAGI53_04150 [Planctomycetota bacterium]